MKNELCLAAHYLKASARQQSSFFSCEQPLLFPVKAVADLKAAKQRAASKAAAQGIVHQLSPAKWCWSKNVASLYINCQLQETFLQVHYHTI
jgi:hypothetical protein